MRHVLLIKAVFALFILPFCWGSIAFGAVGNEFTGRVFDIGGEPVAGAQVYVFLNDNVKRPADFASKITGADGVYSLKLPAGKFWATAIFRQTKAAYGPLAAGDRHSGEAISFTSPVGTGGGIDFTVRNLREAALLNQKKSDTLFKLTGRIVDSAKSPVSMAYIIVDRKEKLLAMPQYYSTWTDSTGAFTVYLPGGKFFIGASTVFPPDNGYSLGVAVNIEKDISALEIIIKEKKR